MPSDKDVKNCPFCGKQVVEKAKRCPFCGRIFRLDFSPQRTPAERKKIAYIAIVSIIFLAALWMIIFIFSDSNKESLRLSSDKIKTSPSKEVFPKKTIREQKSVEAQSPKTSPEDNKNDKSVSEKKESPSKKPTSTDKKKNITPDEPPAKPLPKPKRDNSDFYTLG